MLCMKQRHQSVCAGVSTLLVWESRKFDYTLLAFEVLGFKCDQSQKLSQFVPNLLLLRVLKRLEDYSAA